MIANWVNQATSTTGTGTITLGSAETGFIAFGDALADGDFVPYVIEDGNDREAGIGTYTVSGTTLARTEVRYTLVSGTYDDTSPVAISLSGSATVRIAPSVSMVFEPLLKYKSLHVTNKELRTAGHSGSANNRPGTINRVYYCEYVAAGQIEVASLGFEVKVVAVTGSAAHMGLYKMNSVANTWSRIGQTGSMSTTTTGKKTSAISGGNILLNPGYYLIAYGSDSDATVDGIANYVPQFLPSKDTTSFTRALFESSYSSGLPTSPTFDNNEVESGTFPNLWVVTA